MARAFGVGVLFIPLREEAIPFKYFDIKHLSANLCVVVDIGLKYSAEEPTKSESKS
jgi:hypothetical protein